MLIYPGVIMQGGGVPWIIRGCIDVILYVYKDYQEQRIMRSCYQNLSIPLLMHMFQYEETYYDNQNGHVMILLLYMHKKDTGTRILPCSIVYSSLDIYKAS